MAKRPQPVAVRTRYGTFTTRAEQINQRCWQRRGGNRCQGVFGSALNTRDWAECPQCAAAGYVNVKSCEACLGEGWRYMRRG